MQKNSEVNIVLSKGKITTKNIEVDLTNYIPNDEEKQSVVITIELLDYQDNTLNKVYEKQHYIEEGLLNIPVKGQELNFIR